MQETNGGQLVAILLAPITGVVTEIHKAPGSKVSQGDHLVTLKSEELELKLNRLSTISEILKIERERYAGPAWKLRRRFLEISNDLSNANVAFATDRLSSVQEQVNNGILSHLDLVTAKASMERAVAEHNRAQNNLGLFDLEAARQLKQVDITLSQLEMEAKDVKESDGEAYITATDAGFFNFYYRIGAYFEKGNEVCHLTSD